MNKRVFSTLRRCKGGECERLRARDSSREWIGKKRRSWPCRADWSCASGSWRRRARGGKRAAQARRRNEWKEGTASISSIETSNSRKQTSRAKSKSWWRGTRRRESPEGVRRDSLLRCSRKEPRWSYRVCKSRLSSNTDLLSEWRDEWINNAFDHWKLDCKTIRKRKNDARVWVLPFVVLWKN